MHNWIGLEKFKAVNAAGDSAVNTGKTITLFAAHGVPPPSMQTSRSYQPTLTVVCIPTVTGQRDEALKDAFDD
jgi:hypothetical protein